MLRCLVLVEIFWGVAMIAFETLNTVRMAELVGGEERAGVVMGPVSSAAWGLFAAGAWLGGRRQPPDRGRLDRAAGPGAERRVRGADGPGRRTGRPDRGVPGRYALHGSAGPVHSTLLHRQANRSNRATVLSMNSMVAGGAYSLGLLGLGLLAEHTSVATAILVAGAFSILGAVLYLPAIRQERRGRARSRPSRPRPEDNVDPQRSDGRHDEVGQDGIDGLGGSLGAGVQPVADLWRLAAQYLVEVGG